MSTSRYDSIETALDLVREVRAHGLSLEQNDINRAADIFGHASIKELTDLANDVGAVNEDGFNVANFQRTSSTFYSIAFTVWGWEQATRFFNEHTNPVTKDCKEQARELDECKKQLKLANNLLNACRKDHANYIKIQMDLVKANQEILELKAKLYDLTLCGKAAS